MRIRYRLWAASVALAAVCCPHGRTCAPGPGLAGEVRAGVVKDNHIEPD